MGFTFDLKSGYHHVDVDIHESCHQHLGFMWPVEGVPTNLNLCSKFSHLGYLWPVISLLSCLGL